MRSGGGLHGKGMEWPLEIDPPDAANRFRTVKANRNIPGGEGQELGRFRGVETLVPIVKKSITGVKSSQLHGKPD